MLRRYLILWLILSSLLAVVWPSVYAGSFDPFFASKPWLGWIVAVTMFCVGAVLPKQEVRDVLQQWPLVLGGTTVQYLSMPTLAWTLTMIFSLDPQLEKGIILAGCVPGAMASNVLTMVARGNVTYSVGLTTSATLFSPVIVPLALKLTLGASADTQLLLTLSQLLCIQVVLPTIVGFTLSCLWAGFSSWAQRWAGSIANLSILWIIAVVVGLNRSSFNDLTTTLFWALLLLNLFGYVAGDLGSRLLRLSPGMRRALTLEVGMQNAGVGAGLATSLFPDEPGVALPCGLFAFGCMLTGTILAQWYGRIAESKVEILLPEPR